MADDLYKEAALQRLGQYHYRQKDYEAALVCFTNAIDYSSKPLVAVLDNRAATYTKLGNLRAALDDGRQMILKEKANCSGYLRTGKILQLLDNHQMALDLYEMGIRKVPSSDANITLLQGQREKLARQLAPRNAIDPLQMLPLELAEMTIKYLEFRHTVRLLRVSKSWMQLLNSMPRLWSDLNFSAARKPVNLGAVRKYIKRANGSTNRITLDRFGSNSEKIPRYVATRCRSLNYLKISGGLIGASILEAAPCALNLKTLIISKACQISCSVVSQLLQHCPNLERAEFQSISIVKMETPKFEVDMPKLRTLTLDTPKGGKGLRLPILELDMLLINIPNIHTLSIQGWMILLPVSGTYLDFSNLHQLEELNISYATAELPPQLPSTVRTIAMANCNTGPRNQGVSFTSLDFPKIVRLSLAGWSELSLSDLHACLIPGKGKVTHLDLSGCISLSNIDLKQLITHGYLEGAEDLVLKSCNIDDEIAVLIARNLPRLKKLDLANTRITGVGVKALVVGLEGKLEHLCLDGCYSTNIDAVDLARALGVKVAFGFPDAVSGGRRIKQR